MRVSQLLMTAALLPLLCGAAEIHADFEGGSIGKVEELSPSHLRLAVQGESDQDGRNRQANWYYFRVDGAAANQLLILDIVNLPGEYNYKPNQGAITKDTSPVISYDRVHWTHLTDFEYDAAEPKLRLRVKPNASTFWIAHCPPYTNEKLEKLRKDVRKHRDAAEEIIGKTAKGRELLLWTITHGVAKNRPVVWLMFRQHSWESGSSWAGEGAVRTLLAPENARLRDTAVWKIFPMCDSDGVARGGVRFNVNGFDLNRNWDVVDAQRMPEITAQRAAVKRWIESGHRIDLFMSLHNTETAEYLEAAPAEKDSAFARFAQRYYDLLKAQTTFDPSRALQFAEQTTTAGKPGRMTAVQGLYAQFKVPGFLMEQRVAFNRKLGHFPEIEDRVEFGKQLVKVIAQLIAIH